MRMTVTEAEEIEGPTGGTVGKALAVLEAVAMAGRPVRFVDLLNDMPYPKATLHRLLRTLVGEGMLAHDADRQSYRLGMRLVRMAHLAWSGASLAEAAREVLDRLSEEIGETIHLATLDNDQVLYLDKRTSSHTVQMFSSAGKVGPAYCTGVGKAMLSTLPPDRLQRAIEKQAFRRYTDTTLIKPKTLHADLAAIRERGYAIDREEHESGIICVAVPILTIHGGLLGAMSVTSTTFHNRLVKLEKLTPRLKAAAAEIAQEAAIRLVPGS